MLSRIYSKEGPASNPYAFAIVSYQLLPFLLDCCSIQVVNCNANMWGKALVFFFFLSLSCYLSIFSRHGLETKKAENEGLSNLHREGKRTSAGCAAI